MAMQILKFPVHREVELPKGAIITSAAIVDGQAYVWAAVDKDAKKVKRPLVAAPTGTDLPEAFNFVATVRTQTGLVFHILDMGEETSGSDAFTK